jgi:hypothetical protein
LTVFILEVLFFRWCKLLIVGVIFVLEGYFAGDSVVLDFYLDFGFGFCLDPGIDYSGSGSGSGCGSGSGFDYYSGFDFDSDIDYYGFDSGFG